MALRLTPAGQRHQETPMTARIYTAPLLEELGSFETLTQGASCPDALDATFPAGTPIGDLTCGLEDGMS